MQPRAEAALPAPTNSHAPVLEPHPRPADEASRREAQRRRELRRRIAQLQEELEDYELRPGGRETVSERRETIKD